MGVYCQISGLYRFPFGQEAWHAYTNKYINTYTSENRNILDRLLASRGFSFKRNVTITFIPLVFWNQKLIKCRNFRASNLHGYLILQKLALRIMKQKIFIKYHQIVNKSCFILWLRNFWNWTDALLFLTLFSPPWPINFNDGKLFFRKIKFFLQVEFIGLI